MQQHDQFLKEMFQCDVRFQGDFAKWANMKHPENPNFMQPVFWAAYKTGENHVNVCFYLDKTRVENNHLHCVIPIQGRAFEQVVFDFWSKNL